MSLSSSLHQLHTSTAALSAAVAELVMTVQEDRPTGSELAVVDHLAETVSEFQAGVVEAASALAEVTDTRRLPERLPMVDAALHGCAARYWRDLRAYAVVAELRRSAQGRGVEWRTWLGSVDASERRCQEPLATALAAVHNSWREVGELLSLYLPTWPHDLGSQTLSSNKPRSLT